MKAPGLRALTHATRGRGPFWEPIGGPVTKPIDTEVFYEPYWADIVRLIQVFWSTRSDSDSTRETLDALGREFASPVFPTYLDRRVKNRKRVVDNKQQEEMKGY